MPERAALLASLRLASLRLASLRLASLLLVALAAAPARASQPPAPPAPEVRGPAHPLVRPEPHAAEAVPPLAPEVPEPHAAAPEVAAPRPPTAPGTVGHGNGTATLEDHAGGAIPAASPGAARAAAGDAATAAAAVRGLTGGKKEPAPASREPPVPPTLTGKALAEELRRSAGGRANDQEALAAERARLDRLSREIAEARAALKAETGRLEALVTQAAEAQARAAKGAKPRPGQKGPAAPFETLARTMKSMKADQAAALLTRLDRPLAATLLAGMKPAEAAAVLEKMDSATSASLVTLLAKKESP